MTLVVLELLLNSFFFHNNDDNNKRVFNDSVKVKTSVLGLKTPT